MIYKSLIFAAIGSGQADAMHKKTLLAMIQAYQRGERLS
jgi:hypothetical protein